MNPITYFISPFITFVTNTGVDVHVNVHQITSYHEVASGRVIVKTSNTTDTILVDLTLEEVKVLIETKLKNIQEFK